MPDYYYFVFFEQDLSFNALYSTEAKPNKIVFFGPVYSREALLEYF